MKGQWRGGGQQERKQGCHEEGHIEENWREEEDQEWKQGRCEEEHVKEDRCEQGGKMGQGLKVSMHGRQGGGWHVERSRHVAHR